MVLQIFAIKDRAVQAFMQPFFAPTIGAAIRAFSDGINDKQHAMNAHPDDYDLYHIGEWTDNSGGLMQTEEHPKQVAIGKNLIREQK